MKRREALSIRHTLKLKYGLAFHKMNGCWGYNNKLRKKIISESNNLFLIKKNLPKKLIDAVYFHHQSLLFWRRCPVLLPTIATACNHLH